MRFHQNNVDLSVAFSQAEQNTLMAKLTLHDVFTRFKSDISLSSLGESGGWNSLYMYESLG